MSRYEDRHWSVKLPGGWCAQQDGDTAILTAENAVGLLQIRAFKSDDRKIVDEDLTQLSEHHTHSGAELMHIRYGAFTGFFLHYRSEDELWWEWWLRCDHVALHATYNCALKDKSREEAQVAQTLGSLQLLDDGSS